MTRSHKGSVPEVWPGYQANYSVQGSTWFGISRPSNQASSNHEAGINNWTPRGCRRLLGRKHRRDIYGPLRTSMSCPCDLKPLEISKPLRQINKPSRIDEL